MQIKSEMGGGDGIKKKNIFYLKTEYILYIVYNQTILGKYFFPIFYLLKK